MNNHRVVVVGLGGMGCKVIDYLASNMQEDLIYASIDTDLSSLSRYKATTKIQIGRDEAYGKGTAGDIKLARKSAESSSDILRGLFTDADLVIILGGLGKGVATGVIPFVAEMIQETSALSMAFVTLPFEFESNYIKEQAMEGLSSLSQSIDSVVVIPNSRLADSTNREKVTEVFNESVKILSEGVASVYRLLFKSGYIQLGIADIQRIFRFGSGFSTFNYGYGEGDNKSEDAVNSFISNTLVSKDNILDNAGGMMLSIAGGEDLTLAELGHIMDCIKSASGANVKINMGTIIDNEYNNKVIITSFISEKYNLSSDNTKGKTGTAIGRRKKRGKKSGHSQVQIDFFEKTSRFINIEPTILNGEDIDIPTFIRRKIKLPD